MDIQLKKRPWYIRYKYHIAGGSTFIAFLVYVIILSPVPADFASTRKTFKWQKYSKVSLWNM